MGERIRDDANVRVAMAGRIRGDTNARVAMQGKIRGARTAVYQWGEEFGATRMAV